MRGEQPPAARIMHGHGHGGVVRRGERAWLERETGGIGRKEVCGEGEMSEDVHGNVEEGRPESSDEKIRILLVEDDETHALIMRRILERGKLNTEIFEVRDGESAMDFLLKRGDYADKDYPMPDVVLLDLRLPGIDGTEVLKRIKEDDELREIPVVILTSSDRDEDIMKTYEDGASGYLLKSAFVQKSLRMDRLLDIILSLVR